MITYTDVTVHVHDTLTVEVRRIEDDDCPNVAVMRITSDDGMPVISIFVDDVSELESLAQRILAVCQDARLSAAGDVNVTN